MSLVNGQAPSFGGTSAPAATTRPATTEAPEGAKNHSGLPPPPSPRNLAGDYGPSLANLGSIAVQSMAALGANNPAKPAATQPEGRIRRRPKYSGD